MGIIFTESSTANIFQITNDQKSNWPSNIKSEATRAGQMLDILQRIIHFLITQSLSTINKAHRWNTLLYRRADPTTCKFNTIHWFITYPPSLILFCYQQTVAAWCNNLQNTMQLLALAVPTASPKSTNSTKKNKGSKCMAILWLACSPSSYTPSWLGKTSLFFHWGV